MLMTYLILMHQKEELGASHSKLPDCVPSALNILLESVNCAQSVLSYLADVSSVSYLIGIEPLIA